MIENQLNLLKGQETLVDFLEVVRKDFRFKCSAEPLKKVRIFYRMELKETHRILKST